MIGELLEVLGEGPIYKRIVVVGDLGSEVGAGAEHGFLTHLDEQKGCLDVAISKENLGRCFVECYQSLKSGSTDPIYALGILLMTPEDHTALNIVESSSIDRSFELNVVCSYLTSDLARTNKASSLWLLLRKLAVGEHLAWSTIHRIIMMSVQVHPRNYYAYNTLRYLGTTLRNTDGKAFGELVEKHTRYLLGDGLNDYSGWQALRWFLEPGNEDCYLAEYARHGGRHGGKPAPGVPAPGVPAAYSGSDRKELLGRIEASLERLPPSYSGWSTLTSITGTIPAYLRKTLDDFEESHGPVDPSVDSSEFDDDLLLKETYRHAVVAKRVSLLR